MIKFMTTLSEAEKAYEFDPVLGARIYTLYNCYQNDYSFVRLWVSYNKNNKITACMSIMSGVATIAASAQCDLEELAIFFGKDATIDVFEIDKSTGEKFNQYLNYSFITRPIMKFEGELNYSGPKYAIFTDVMKYTFKILKDSDEDFKNADFMSWFYDTHKRVKNENCEIYAIKYDGKWVSTGGYYISSPIAAVIGGIATKPEYRGQGFASDLVMFLTKIILDKQKDSFLIAANEDLAKFYDKLGYKRISTEMCIEVPFE